MSVSLLLSVFLCLHSLSTVLSLYPFFPFSPLLLSHTCTRRSVLPSFATRAFPFAASYTKVHTYTHTHTHTCATYDRAVPATRRDGLVRKCSKCQISFLRQSKGENKSPCREELITMYCYEMMKKRGKKKKEKRLRAIFIDEKQMFR